MKKLEQKHEDKIRDFGNQTIGAFYNMEKVTRGGANDYESIFFVLEEDTKDCDFTLPRGQYLSCFFRGSYNQNKRYCQKVLQYAKENNLENDGKLFEFYHIDNRDTVDEKEFLTEIQLRLLN
jgi:effector-binding domain-containing protein